MRTTCTTLPILLDLIALMVCVCV